MATANLFAQYLQPIRSVADYSADLDRRDAVRMQLEGQRRQNALADMAANQQVQRQNALQRVASGWDQSTTDEQRIQSLRSNPLTFDAADALEKSLLERTKTRAAAAKDQSDASGKDVETENKVIGVYRDMIGMAQSPEAAAELVRVMHSDPRLAKTALARVPLEQGLAQIAVDPQGFAQWKQQFGLGATKFIEQNKPTLTTQNLGGTSRIVATPGLGGPSSVVTEAPITQSPDNAATVAATLRGQNLVDQRAREQLAQGGNQYDSERGMIVNTRTGLARPAATMDGKPIGAKDKPLTDSQAKAYAFGTRMSAANDIIAELEQQGTKTTTPGMGGNGVVGRVVTALAPEKQQQLEQAKRDWINANLRRESGAVIGQSEFDSADRQYFAQPGDSPAVIKQKAANRKRAEQGVLAEVPSTRSPSQPTSLSGVVDWGSLK